MKKRISFFLLTITIFACFWVYASNNSFASSDFNLKKINFDVMLNEDGSMDVVETWDISVQSMTNTLFKTFEVDNSKYKEITNVHVSEIIEGRTNEFTQKNVEVNHVDKNCYYGLINSKGQYEIAWGINEKRGNKTYKIEYTVIDAVKSYADCSELYWQFIGKDFEIDVDKISGTIKLERPAEMKENIRAWAHGPINGNISIDSTNQISFEVEFLDKGNFIEIRMALPNELFTSNNNVSEKTRMNQILTEEAKWAQEANEIRDKKAREQEQERQIIQWCLIALMIGISIYSLVKIVKSHNILIKNPKMELPQKIDYYREIPNENTTPAQESFIYYFNKSDFKSLFPKVMSSTMLNLCLKGYLKFENEINKKGKGEIRVYILSGTKNLSEDEIIILNLLKNINQESFTMKEMENYAKKHYDTFYKTIGDLEKEVKKVNSENGNYNQELYRQGKKYSYDILVSILSSIIILILAPIFIMKPIVWICMVCMFIIIKLVQIIYAARVAKRLVTLTQKGLEEQEKLNALKRYLEDFSMIEDKTVPELILWEKYLVYATLFGIADKVLKQLKIVYPQITEDGFSYGNYIGLMYYSGLNNSFIHNLESGVSNAYVSAKASYDYANSSSGGGYGGGFSVGGGGRRRWPEVAVDAKMSKKREKRRKSKKKT